MNREYRHIERGQTLILRNGFAILRTRAKV
jgi:hypothetical protein